jgi:hypothetical protein
MFSGGAGEPEHVPNRAGRPLAPPDSTTGCVGASSRKRAGAGYLARVAPAGDEQLVAVGCDTLAGGSCVGSSDEARLTACGM